MSVAENTNDPVEELESCILEEYEANKLYDEDGADVRVAWLDYAVLRGKARSLARQLRDAQAKCVVIQERHTALMKEADRRVDEAEQQLREAREDARRYRRLRENIALPNDERQVFVWLNPSSSRACNSAEELDATIDTLPTTNTGEEVIEIDEDGKVHLARCQHCGKELPLPATNVAPQVPKGNVGDRNPVVEGNRPQPAGATPSDNAEKGKP